MTKISPPLIRHLADNRVHLSELKEMRRSPAHYRHACLTSREITRPMRVGFVTDRLVFGGGGYETFAGPTRSGPAWRLALSLMPPGVMLVTAPEAEDAAGAAAAVLADPVARAALEGCEYQRVAQWSAYGLDCASGIAGERGGFDAIGHGAIYDLKTTASADPRELGRHVLRMCWHAQGAWYVDGARALGYDVERFALICVEAQPPHVVTVLRLPAAMLDLGRRSLRLWTERLRQCDEADVWHGYVQSETECEVPEWALSVEDDDS